MCTSTSVVSTLGNWHCTQAIFLQASPTELIFVIFKFKCSHLKLTVYGRKQASAQAQCSNALCSPLKIGWMFTTSKYGWLESSKIGWLLFVLVLFRDKRTKIGWLWKNHPHMDDYRCSIIIHFWNENVPQEKWSTGFSWRPFNSYFSKTVR